MAERWCTCIMLAHCHEKKAGKCRLSTFGTGSEGSPGVAGPAGALLDPPEHQAEGREEFLGLLEVVEEVWPALRDPSHPRHEKAPNAGRKLRVAAEKARTALEGDDHGD